MSPKNTMRQLAVRGEPALWARLERIAIHEQRDRSNLIRKMLRDACDAYEREHDLVESDDKDNPAVPTYWKGATRTKIGAA